jgi:hypothetical protein
MSKGMLWGALGGAARAGTEVMDNQIKAQGDERKRVQSIEDRREAMIFEMEQKDKWARSREEVEAKGFERADTRAGEIRDERGAREFKGGMGMLSNLEEMGISPDTALQRAQDRMTGGREVGAPGSVRKELTADFNNEVKTDNQRKKEAAREAQDEKKAAEREAAAGRAEEGRNSRLDKQITASDARQSRTIAAAVGRRGRDDDKPESVTTLRGVMNDIGKDRPKLDDFRGNAQKHDDALAAWNKSDQGLQYKELQDEIKMRTTGAPKPVAPESTVKDNPSSTIGRKVGATQTVAAGPNKGKTVVWDGKGWTLK